MVSDLSAFENGGGRMKGWNRFNNSELIKSGVLEIGDGYRAKNAELDINGLPFARAGNINDGFRFDDADLLCIKSVFKAGNKISQPFDCVITTKGTFGRVAYVRRNTKQFVYSPQLCYWRSKNKKLLDSRFLYYWLQSPDFLSQAFQIKSSTDMADYASLGDQRSMSIGLPPPRIQRKIAAVLSAYDDLIENNNRRIAILERMAEELYREWFVRLRFPGHEKVKIIKGVPEGWEIKIVEHACEYLGGGTPSTSANSYWQDGNINWYSPTDLTASNAVFAFQSKQQITEQGLKESSARLFPAYSIMMTSRATIGQISINTTPACTNQGFITCIPNDKVPLYFLYYWLKLNKDYFIQLANGATFLELTKGKFKNVNILIPPDRIIKLYSKIQKPIFDNLELLLRQKENLAISRDRLLIRLMSGKIDVEHLDIQIPASMKEEAAGNA